MPAGASRCRRSRAGPAALAREAERRQQHRRRRPVASAWTSARSRSSSCHCGPADARQPARRPGGPAPGLLSSGLADQRELADPGDRPRAAASASRRSLRLAASRSATSPAASAARRPPARSISWNQAQAARASSSVRSLDVPGAARRVDDPGDVGFLDQQRLGVAGDPAGERVRQPDRRVEGQHGDRVGAADAGREAGQGGAQDVVPRVAAGHHRPGGDRVLPLPRGVGGDAARWATRAQSRRAARSLAIVGNWSAVAA